MVETFGVILPHCSILWTRLLCTQSPLLEVATSPCPPSPRWQHSWPLVRVCYILFCIIHIAMFPCAQLCADWFLHSSILQSFLCIDASRRCDERSRFKNHPICLGTHIHCINLTSIQTHLSEHTCARSLIIAQSVSVSASPT